jgi:LPXTG-motif cell wall-anchored protein
MMIVGTMGLALATTAPSFTLTVSNTDQNVSHNYKAYQIFTGDLNANKLTNIDWGDGVNSSALITALLGNDSPLKTSLTTALGTTTDYTTAAAAQALAKALEGQTGTEAATATAGDLDKIASIIAANVVSTAGTALTESSKNYTASLAAGYYIVVDETTSLTNEDDKSSDTKSKSMLAVVEDVTITAKDTGLKPDKKILKANGADFTEVAADSSAIGDEVKFQVKINVPDTRKYLDHFVFHMVDQLPAGLTYKADSLAIKINGVDYAATGTYGYTTTVKTGETNFSAPQDNDYVNSTGGQSIKVVFNNFKAYVDANPGLIGKDIVITYSAYVNKNADFTPTGNENEVKFEYSNDPDHDYDGDDFEQTDPKGETPKSKTKTFLTNLQIKKVDQTNTALAGAEFEITGTTYNTTLVTGEHYVEWTEGTKYWELKDGTYTTTDPAGANVNQSKYADTTKVYMKASYSDTVVTPTGTPETVTAISGSDGLITLKGLNAGTYTITETSAPAGYNKIEGTKTIEITFNASTGKFESTSSDFQYDATNDVWYITIQNNSGAELPSTGGIGTTIFYIAGIVMVLGAAAIVIARRKAEQE